MLRSLFCRPSLVRGFRLVTQHLPGGEVVLTAAHDRGDRKQTAGAGILWAAPLPIAVAAAGREEEEGQWKTLPQGYNWENSKSKDRIQEQEQVEQEQQQQVEEQLEQVEQVEEQATVDSAKKRTLDARKRKELNDKRVRLDTYGKQFDQRFVAVTSVSWTIMKLILNDKSKFVNDLLLIGARQISGGRQGSGQPGAAQARGGQARGCAPCGGSTSTTTRSPWWAGRPYRPCIM